MTGSLPWFSIEAGADEIWIIAKLPIADSAEVDRCMNCPYATCHNCMDSRGKKRKQDSAGRPRVCDIETIRHLINEGKSNSEICEVIGCSEKTANRYRKLVVMA